MSLNAAKAPLPMLILGIDPGLAHTGWGVIELRPPAQSRLVAFGVISTEAGQTLAARLHAIQSAVAALIREHRPHAMAIEELFFAKNARTAMAVAHGRAASIIAAGAAGIDVFEYTPLQLKQALTGKGSAGKLQVQQMVKVVLGLPTIPQPNHAADALAAALCHAHGLRLGLGRTASQAARRKTVEPAADPDPQRAARKALLAQRRR